MNARRNALCLMGGLFTAALLVPALPAVAGSANTPVRGQGQAVLAKVVPYVGLPGVAASVGLVTAAVDESSIRSTAAAADFGLLGTLAGSGVEGVPALPGLPPLALPQPIVADGDGQQEVTRDLPAADGGLPASGIGAVHEGAEARTSPRRAAGTVSGATFGVPGLLEISGATSSASATAQRSESEVRIASVSLGGGAVVLSGLRWNATKPTGKQGVSAFDVAGISVAGTALPATSPEAIAAALPAANEALRGVGLSLTLPVDSVDATGAGVGPLVLQVRNPEATADALGATVTSARPTLDPLVSGLLASSSDAQSAQLVVNALLGAAGGQSGGRLELGGVSASATPLELLTETGAHDRGAAPPFTAPSFLPRPPSATFAPPIPEDTATGSDPVLAIDGNETAPRTLFAGPAQSVGNQVRDTADRAAPFALAAVVLAVLVLAGGDRLRSRLSD